jgi:cellulose synthase/poly-beta-1,6-N-acetylglucosamine synthase-like glycosyltransferase
MNQFLQILYYLPHILYFVLNMILVFVWLKMQKKQSKSYKNTFTIIVPVRNEALNILNLLQDLEAQNYPKNQFEVIVANDDSTDETANIVQDFAKKATFTLILNNLKPEIKPISPKKRAIQSSVKLANFDTIVSTDGDCRVGESWLASLAAAYNETDAYLLSAAVTFEQEKTPFGIFQSIEFASLIGTGACSMFLKKPNMCNGANLSYKKSIFEAVDGFAGSEQIASGDDEFLMHKIAKAYPDKVHFLKNTAAIVKTQANDSFAGFIQQRRRWASKWNHYKNWETSALAIFVFAINFLTATALCAVITECFFRTGFINSSLFINSICLKFVAEFIFLYLILDFLGKKHLFWAIPLVQIVYPFYVVFVGLLAQKKGYEWKGRKLS